MSQVIQNRFTKTTFDAAQSVYVGEGKLLTARYACQGRAWKATIHWKPGYEKDFTSLTTLDEAAMKSALLRLDSTVRFLGKVNTAPVAPTQTLADKTSEMLEALRTDPQTSDKAYISACQLYRQKPKPRNAPAETRATQNGPVLSTADQRTLEAMRVDMTVTAQAYRNACAKFGVQPQPRPQQAVTSAAQTAVPFFEQDQAWQAFAQSHGELFVAPFSVQNARIIVQWLKDENRQSDAGALEQAYRECSAAGYFRDARTMARDMSGNLRIVRPYNHAELVAARQQQTVDAVNAPPDYLSDVERDAWQAVRQKYPTLSVRSAGFNTCVRDTLVLWAKEYCIEQQPQLGATNAKGQLAYQGELNAAITKVLNSWAKISNPRMNKRVDEKGNERIWLG